MSVLLLTKLVKKRSFPLVAVGAIAALAVCLGVASKVQAVVGGPACMVPADYANIQAAVNDAGCTTVKVAAGTYTENVTVNRAVKIKGAKAGVPAKVRTYGVPSESTVTGNTPGSATFTVNAPDVTIDGFSIRNADQVLGVLVKTAGNELMLKNNIVDGVGNDALADPSVGVYLELGPDEVSLVGNVINNVKSGTKSAQGVLVGDSTSGNPSLKTVIKRNQITNIVSTTKGGYGIQVNNGAKTDPTATGYSEVWIEENTIKNISGGWVHAIGLEGETPNGIVKKNVISDLTTNANGPDKVGVFFEDNPFFFTTRVTRNSLDVGTSGFGVAVAQALSNTYPSLNVNATCNWWGSRSGPGMIALGAGSKVGPNVTYKPWLKSANLEGRCGDRDYDDHDDDDDDHGWRGHHDRD